MKNLFVILLAGFLLGGFSAEKNFDTFYDLSKTNNLSFLEVVEVLDLETSNPKMRKLRNYWDGFGLEYLEENGEIAAKRFFVFTKPKQTSEKIYYSDVYLIEIIGGNDIPFGECTSKPSVCRIIKKSSIFVNLNPKKDEEITKRVSFRDFIFLDTPIEELRLVWISEFLNSFAELEYGESLTINGITYKAWDDSGPDLFKDVKKETFKSRVYDLGVGPSPNGRNNYFITLCEQDLSRRQCLSGIGLTTIYEIEFVSFDEIKIFVTRFIP